jgi:hypothetical protein
MINLFFCLEKCEKRWERKKDGNDLLSNVCWSRSFPSGFRRKMKKKIKLTKGNSFVWGSLFNFNLIFVRFNGEQIICTKMRLTNWTDKANAHVSIQHDQEFAFVSTGQC